MDWKEERKLLRKQEKELRKEYNKMKMNTASPEGNPRTLEGQLSRLPSYLRPTNVGAIDKVAWPFWFQANFDFGTNPTLTSTTSKVASFQVTQEASFILMAIFRKSYSYTTAGELGPWQITIRDRQSTRQFNDRPIPMQMIGIKSRPSILPTPMIIAPNAFIDVTMGCWLPEGTSQATTGDAKFQFSFFGYRTRAENADKILSTIYG